MSDILLILGTVILLMFAIVGISCTVAYIVGKIFKTFNNDFDVLSFFEDKEKDR